MASLKDMRNRIASVQATQKITKAMQLVAALAADHDQPDFLAGIGQLDDPLARSAHDRGIEAAGEAPV